MYYVVCVIHVPWCMCVCAHIDNDVYVGQRITCGSQCEETGCLTSVSIRLSWGSRAPVSMV